MSGSRDHSAGVEAPRGASISRLDGLQIARALAALTVVVGHAVEHPLNNQGHPAWQLGGRYGVTLFFVVSGFIMVHTTGAGKFDPVGFMSRRIRRVVPIYWVVTFLVAALALLAPQVFKRTVFDLAHFIASLFFVPMYDPADPGSISPIFRLGWTLNYEMFFYLCFAATFFLGVTARNVALTLFFGTCIALGFLVDFQSAILKSYTQIDTFGFVAGMWLGWLGLRDRLRPAAVVIAGLLIFSFASLAGVAFWFERLQDVPMTQVLIVAICAAHVAALLLLVDGLGWKAPRALLLVGDASYSMYLFHMFAVGAVSVVIARAPESLTIPLIGVSILCSIAAGIVAYWVVEKPLNRLMRKRRPLTAAQIGEGARSS